MKLEIEKMSCGNGDSLVLDTYPKQKHFTIEASAFSLFELKAIKGSRMLVRMVKPSCGFFFSIADIMDKKKGTLTILFDEINDLIGGYVRI